MSETDLSRIRLPFASLIFSGPTRFPRQPRRGWRAWTICKYPAVKCSFSWKSSAGFDTLILASVITFSLLFYCLYRQIVLGFFSISCSWHSHFLRNWSELNKSFWGSSLFQMWKKYNKPLKSAFMFGKCSSSDCVTCLICVQTPKANGKQFSFLSVLHFLTTPI